MGAPVLIHVYAFLEFRASVLFMMQDVSWLICLEPEEREVFMPFSLGIFQVLISLLSGIPQN